MAYWAWAILGILLLAAEVASTTFFALFFGVGALLVALLVGLGWAGPAWMQWLLFSAFSLVALALLRGPLRGRLNLHGPQRPVDSLVGEAGSALEDIAAGAIGKAELRGTTWSARNAGADAVAKGQRVKVDRVEGLMLHVHKE
jgi:membrane protein implicated in regulation of membrane protease activity